VLKVIKIIGFIVLLCFVSYLGTSVIYYSRDHTTVKRENLKLIEDVNIEVIGCSVCEYISLDIKVFKYLSDEYLIGYALNYKDIYNKEVHLYVVDKEMIVNTGKNVIFVQSKTAGFIENEKINE
jgi:hypothetical protein